MGFSVKIAPGVRVRASSRGVRTSIGPRVARVHVGAGRTGFPPERGPWASTPLLAAPAAGRVPVARARRSHPCSGRLLRRGRLRRLRRRRRRRSGSRLPCAKSSTCTARNSRPLSGPSRRYRPHQMSVRSRSRHEHAALQGIGLFKRAERAAAKQRAAAAAVGELAALRQQAETAAAQAQAGLDAQWRQLLANDPETVISTLAEAFEDNEAPAAPISVDSDEVSLAVPSRPIAWSRRRCQRRRRPAI